MRRLNFVTFIYSVLIGLSIYAIIGCYKQQDIVAVAELHSHRPVLILDAGHGGEDGGAVSPSGMAESGINLDIAKRTKDLALFFGVETVMTRESEEIAYPAEATTIAARKRWDTQQRVALINDVKNGLLVSIHQNKYPDSRPRGPQVFYGGRGDDEGLAVLTHANLSTCLYPESRRVAAPSSEDIYVMAHAQCPSILVECGFLSHPEESALLATESYRLKIAAILMASYLQYTEAIYESEDQLLLQ